MSSLVTLSWQLRTTTLSPLFILDLGQKTKKGFPSPLFKFFVVVVWFLFSNINQGGQAVD